MDLFVSRQQFRTHLKGLGEGLALADRNGLSSTRVGRQWCVTSISLTSPNLPARDLEAGLKEATGLRERAFAKAGLKAPKHRLRAISTDVATADPASPPFAIYPFDPDTCARLTCDLLSFETVLGWDRLADALRDEGFNVSTRLPNRSEPAAPASRPVFVASRANRGITIHGGAIPQVLLEFVDPKSYAAAVSEAFDRLTETTRLVLTFQNERAVWK
jgi:hypothetical protein